MPFEELYKGATAKEFLEEPIIPLLKFLENDYNVGGAVVISSIIAIFFTLFGKTVFALKLTPISYFHLSPQFIFI